MADGGLPRHARNAVERDVGIGVVVLRGGGKRFSTGGDVRRMAEQAETGTVEDRLSAGSSVQWLTRMYRNMLSVNQPIIASVNVAHASVSYAVPEMVNLSRTDMPRDTSCSGKNLEYLAGFGRAIPAHMHRMTNAQRLAGLVCQDKFLNRTCPNLLAIHHSKQQHLSIRPETHLHQQGLFTQFRDVDCPKCAGCHEIP